MAHPQSHRQNESLCMQVIKLPTLLTGYDKLRRDLLIDPFPSLQIILEHSAKRPLRKTVHSQYGQPCFSVAELSPEETYLVFDIARRNLFVSRETLRCGKCDQLRKNWFLGRSGRRRI